MKPTILRRIAIAVFCVLTLGVVPAAHAATTYTITVLIPLTGYGAFFGIPQVQALRAIEAWVNRTGGIKGTPLHFDVKDDATNPQTDVQLASLVFAQHPAVMLGPDTTGQCNAVMPLAKDGPVVYCFTPSSHPPAGGYVFSSGTTTDYVMRVSAHYFSAHGMKKIAIISTTDATGQDGDRQLANAIAVDTSMTLVDRQYYNVSDVSVTAQLAHIAASHPQALLLVATGTPFGTFLRGFQTAGINVPLMVSAGNLLYGELRQFASLMPNNVLFSNNAYLDPASVPDKGVRDAIEFMSRELATMGAKADQGHNSDWDATMQVVEALRKYGTGATAQQIRDYIANLKNWPGIDGRYDFSAEPQRGLKMSSVIVFHYDPKNESFTAVSGPGGAELRGR